jgi:tetratricopeptide (TPR) repeat protein
MIRCLIVLGRVNEGLASLRQAAALAAHVSETMVHQVDAMSVSVAAQIGDPDLAPVGDVAGAPLEGAMLGWTEVASQQGLITLQRGDVDAALQQLESADHSVFGPYRRAFSVTAVALAYAAAGRPDDARRAATTAIEELNNTYLDRASAHAATGFAESQQGSLDGAEAAFARALAEVDATEDVLAQAVLRLAYGRALEALDAPLATPVLVDARGRLNAIGIPASGWDTVFRIAARGGPANGQRGRSYPTRPSAAASP